MTENEWWVTTTKGPAPESSLHASSCLLGQAFSSGSCPQQLSNSSVAHNEVLLYPTPKNATGVVGGWQGWGWGSYSKKRSFRKQKEIVFTAGFAFLFLVKSYLCGSDTSIIHFSLGSAKSSRSGDRTVTREVAAQSCLLFASPWHFVLDLEQLVKPSHRLLVETMTKKITKYTGEWGKSGYSSVAFPTFPKCHSQL